MSYRTVSDPTLQAPPAVRKKPIFRSFTGDKTLKRMSISGPTLKVDTDTNTQQDDPKLFTPSSTTSARRSSSMTLSPSIINMGTPVWSTSSYKLENELKRSHTRVTIRENDNEIGLIIPTIVHKCCSFISSQPPVEGIFRINGALKKIKKIEMKIKEHGIDEFEFADCTISDNSNENNIEDSVATSYDAAMVLKRWLLDLEDGLITMNVNESLKSEFSNNFIDLLPHSQEQEKQVPTKGPLENDLKSSPTDDSEGEFSEKEETYKTDTSSISISEPDKAPLSKPEIRTCENLKKLPIENMNLFIYLLNFLYKLADPSIVKVTKMSPLNLSKIFQLSFFKSDDLTAFNPLMSGNSFDNSNNSAEDLLVNYKINEQILKFWIDSYHDIFQSLKPSIIERKPILEELLISPITAEEPTELLRNPKLRNRSASSDDKQSKRKSVFGSRSLSNALGSRALSSTLNNSSTDSLPIDRRSVSDSSNSRTKSMFISSLVESNEVTSPESIHSPVFGTDPSSSTTSRKAKRKSFSWFNSNSSAPNLSIPKTRKPQQSQHNNGILTDLISPPSISRPISYSTDDLRTSNLSTDTLALKPTTNTNSVNSNSYSSSSPVVISSKDVITNIENNSINKENNNNYKIVSKIHTKEHNNDLYNNELASTPKTTIIERLNNDITDTNTAASATVGNSSTVNTTANPSTATVQTKKMNRLSKLFSVRFGLSKMAH